MCEAVQQLHAPQTHQTTAARFFCRFVDTWAFQFESKEKKILFAGLFASQTPYDKQQTCYILQQLAARHFLQVCGHMTSR